MFQALAFLVKYWPIIRLVLRALRENQGLIAWLDARPGTDAATDARDIFRKLDGIDYWSKIGEDLS